MDGLIYLVVIIAFAIFSSANAASKSKNKNKTNPPRGGMPTFGGGPDDRAPRGNGPGAPGEDGQRTGGLSPRSAMDQPKDGPYAPSGSSGRPERELLDLPSYPGDGRMLDYPQADQPEWMGEGVSMEHRDERLDSRNERDELDRTRRQLERTQLELDRTKQRLDRVNRGYERLKKGRSSVSGSAYSMPEEGIHPDRLREGVRWSEILGQPRSKKPLQYRK